MKVLITGNEGFVGRNFQKYLEKRGHTCVGVDIKSGYDCRNFFKNSDEKFDLVVHLAAIVGGRESIENEPLSVATDLSIDSEMFNWAVRTSQPKIIYYSSSAAYPIKLQKKGLKTNLKESMIDLNNISNPDLSYGWSKLTGEMLAEYAKKSGVDVHVFRPMSGFGSDQDLTYPFPSFLKRVFDRADSFEIWGDGTQVRDFIHIDDIIECTMKAVELDIKQPLNLGWGRPTDFNTLANMMFDVSGWSPKNGIKHLHHKPVGVMYRCCDPTNLFAVCKPKITLEEAIERCLHEFKGVKNEL